MEILVIILSMAITAIMIIALVKFFEMAGDVRAIKKDIGLIRQKYAPQAFESIEIKADGLSSSCKTAAESYAKSMNK